MEFIGIATYTYAREACYICGRNEGLVDTGTFIEGEGELAICDNCIKEAARTAGLGEMIDQQHVVDELHLQLATAQDELDNLTDRHSILVERFAGLQAEIVAAQDAQKPAVDDEPQVKPKARNTRSKVPAKS